MDRGPQAAGTSRRIHECCCGRPQGFVSVGEATDVSVGAAAWTSSDGRTWERMAEDATFVGPAGPDYGTAMTDVAILEGSTSVVGYSAIENDSTVAMTWLRGSNYQWSRTQPSRTEPGGLRVIARGGDFLGVWTGQCPGSIWASPDGGSWQCDVRGPGPGGLVATAVAASDTTAVAVGM